MKISITIVLYITFKKTINLARSISMSMLNSLPNVHTTPINPVVYWGSYLRRESNLILKQVSHLDAFSGYLYPTWLPSCATDMTTG